MSVRVWVRGLNFNLNPTHLLSWFILGISIEKVGLEYYYFYQ